MPEISIKKFSCIKDASIQLKRLNVIIGPQGSGKSVTTKLVYFFADILADSLRYAEDGIFLSDYKKNLQKRFSLWFPPIAWGEDKFFLNYTDEKYSIRIMRRMSGGSPTDEVSIKLSKEFEESYEFAVALFKSLKSSEIGTSLEVGEAFARSTLEASWRARDEAWAFYRKTMGPGIVNDQTFIPAGRAFFTSIGRLVAGIEHAGSLDPATLKFAKLFANWRDRLESFRPHFAESESYHKSRLRIMGDLFDGVVQSKRGLEYIEMRDGRKVPFSSLSSGQQELLPLWYFLDNILLMEAFLSRQSKRGVQNREGELIYIEEPEAHLFPEAQSKLLDTLVEVVISGNRSRSLIITTHSPYIMTKLNVLLKAGQISRRKKKNKELGEIVERATWLHPSDVAALSIKDGIVGSIMDEDLDLIDAAFLDSISDVTAEKFSMLLDLEDAI